MAGAIRASGSLFHNRLLGALPEPERQRLSHHLQPVELFRGQILREEGRQSRYAYFPTTTIVSLLNSSLDGVCTEVAAVGNEGLLGVMVVLGFDESPLRAAVRSKGWAYRIDGAVLREEFMRGGPIQLLLLRYIQALLTIVSQMAVCNGRHAVEQQLCRWLLLTLDLMDSPELTMTHELLANLLGVRREGITEAARRFQSARLIDYRRGRITVLDRAGIEARSCECYGVIRGAYDQLTTKVHHSPRHTVPPRSGGAARTRWTP